jgi:hypothetical protein
LAALTLFSSSPVVLGHERKEIPKVEAGDKIDTSLVVRDRRATVGKDGGT